MREQAIEAGIDPDMPSAPNRPLEHAEAVERSRQLRANLERQLQERRN